MAEYNVSEMQRIITSVSEATASGFKVAVDAHMTEVRRSLESVADAVLGLTKSVEALKEGQNERKVLFAQMQARIDNSESDVKELKEQIKTLTTNVQDATGLINKGIGAALVISVILPLLLSLALKFWH